MKIIIPSSYSYSLTKKLVMKLTKAISFQLLITLLLLFVFKIGLTQSIDTKTPIIIDTDAGVDDLRAISLFMAIENADILAITTTGGNLSSQQGLKKINNLLHYLKTDNIETAAGKKTATPPPPWRKFSENIYWGEKTNNKFNPINAKNLIIKKLKNYPEPVTIICLGTLTNLRDILQSSNEIKNKIKKVIWYNKSIFPFSGFNYEFDKNAADSVFTTDININVISNLDKALAVFNQTFLDSIINIDTKYAQIISKAYKNVEALNTVKSGHAKLWDDLIPVYFLYPELFDIQPIKKKPNFSINKNYNVKAVREKILKILAKDYEFETNVVFDKFPINPENYKYDVRQFMDTIIKKYGTEEWRACVLTDELHQHLGIYSTVGAKMGLKAREIFKVPIDQLQVISFAGNRPPIGCMNDGLQIGAGATLGHGVISIANDTIARPEAIFIYNGIKKRLTLKKEYTQQVRSDISKGIVEYGNLTSGYWKLIRKLSIKYWLEWDRNKIFDVENVK
ncbi:MAG: nucleoside hydrolase [Bacteroidales bacterium]|nr:nucleoside hydrolase [Bacteroidales bacterium]